MFIYVCMCVCVCVGILYIWSCKRVLHEVVQVFMQMSQISKHLKNINE